jgi:hypothetical protein
MVFDTSLLIYGCDCIILNTFQWQINLTYQLQEMWAPTCYNLKEDEHRDIEKERA